ncbi:MAG: class I tRNA ligase family protein [Patescibacteria group bacterium]
MNDETNALFSLPKEEEKILEYWKRERIFEKTLERRAPRGDFVFYEGPPSANGRPGLHHVLARVFKDAVCRYKTMTGYRVLRKAGWDTHGLPVEIQVEKELGLKTKKAIEEYGIGRFNARARETVWRYKEEWERLTERIGFWLDQEDPYITYDSSYIQTLWHLIAAIHKKKLFYKDFKVVPYCPRCGTALSSHEVALGYKNVTDNSVFIRFKIKSADQRWKNAYILSWTTTPWTLPGNVALAINPDIMYIKVQGVLFPDDAEKKPDYIFAANLKTALSEILGHFAESLETFKGSELDGLDYVPLFPVQELKSKKSYKIYPADFVTAEDGTGVVHTAVMYGDDDFRLGNSVGLPKQHTVDETGRFVADFGAGLKGRPVKAAETEKIILNYLLNSGALLKMRPYPHEYPFCWRCDHPLLYYAASSWFIAVSRLRKQLLANNKKITWIPAHMKDGRFGEWLKDAKDWALSRTRYWGTPLPVWECESCDKRRIVGALSELDKNSPRDLNTYLLLRHGEAETNAKQILSSWPESGKYHLTEHGKKQIEKQIPRLRKEKVDLIFSSDLLRTKETTAIIGRALKKPVRYDARLREHDTGIYNGRPTAEWHERYTRVTDQYAVPPKNGESMADVRRRMVEFLRELDRKYSGKRILIVSHGNPITAAVVGYGGYDQKETPSIEKKFRIDQTGTLIRVRGHNWPYNADGELDLHRPFVDDIRIRCNGCNGAMRRVPEVMDVWFDSGAMPFAQNNAAEMQYPADFICEGVDQTRGWFYTLHAIGALMDRGPAYRAVIALGHVLDEKGEKMSKSKGNVVDPWNVIARYGADALRWYFFTVNPAGEPKHFAERDVGERLRRTINTLENMVRFYKMYGAPLQAESTPRGTKNPLDRWILSRLQGTIARARDSFERYELTDAARAIEQLIDDASRWWLRRSRARFQHPTSDRELQECSAVLRTLLETIAHLAAPLIPFVAEFAAKELGATESVHIAGYPVRDKLLVKTRLEQYMEEARRIATLALAERSKVGIKVRQPLALLAIRRKTKKPNTQIILPAEILDIVKDEINVRDIHYDETLASAIALDTVLTPDLKAEGFARELIRNIQDLRKDARLKPQDAIRCFITADAEAEKMILAFQKTIAACVLARPLVIGKSEKYDAMRETRIDGHTVRIGIST